jgi:hypothetical protein
VGWTGIKGQIRLLIREHGLLLRVVIGAVAFLFVAFFLWQLVDPRTPEQRTAFIQTMGGIVGGSALLFGLYFTARNLQVSQEGQITERFTRAIDQLGSDKIEIRLGGIYALERIARDSERDHWPIMEVLTAYVREQAPGPLEEGQTRGDDGAKEKPEEDSNAEPASTDVPPPDPDVQAIMTVISRRTQYWGQGETELLDLRGIDLRGADLRKANFVGANLSGANFSRAELRGADLRNVNLVGANLSGTMLWKTNLSGASLYRANLYRANLVDADLSEVNKEPSESKGLDIVNLHRANLVGANLSGANLVGADLRRATLWKADLRGADLVGADLRRVDLSGALHLTQEQVEHVRGDETTTLPNHLTPPAYWSVNSDEPPESG